MPDEERKQVACGKKKKKKVDWTKGKYRAEVVRGKEPQRKKEEKSREAKRVRRENLEERREEKSRLEEETNRTSEKWRKKIL